jgi:hypothetical protein
MAKCLKCGKKMDYYDKCYPVFCGYLCIDCYKIQIEIKREKERRKEIII